MIKVRWKRERLIEELSISKSIHNFYTIQIISISHFNSVFKSVAPVKLPVTGATSSNLEEEARVIYLLLIKPQPLRSNPIHPKPGIKIQKRI
tara:strand:- start:41 stop:316 length:276 start_codon:yes stop_codon:yes gene_type:complete